MSEFKGTKGKWGIRKTFDEPISVKSDNYEWFHNSINIIENTGRIIADVSFNTDSPNMGWGHNDTDEKWKANALLISKAPEMLEMLIELSEIFDKYSVNPEQQFSKYKQPLEKLIKEATTL